MTANNNENAALNPAFLGTVAIRAMIGMSLLTTTEGWTAGQVVVWGSNYQGQQSLPSDLTNSIAVPYRGNAIFYEYNRPSQEP